MPAHSLSELRTRPTLLFRLRDWDDAASWEEFYRLYRNFVQGLAERAGLSRAEAEEVTQDVFRRVAETIAEFEARPQRGSFRRWLMNLTRWRIADKFRERPAEAAGAPRPRDEGTATLDRLPDEREVDAAWDEEWRKHVFEAALERVARRVKPRHFQAFDLYVRQRRPVRTVAGELGMGVAAVYLAGYRITQQLKAEVKLLEKKCG